MRIELSTLGIVALVVYLMLLIVIAMAAKKQQKSQSPKEHYLAGGKLGLVTLFLTLYATIYSGNSLIGYAGEAYNRGFIWIMSIGFMMSMVVAFHLFVPKLRPMAVSFNFITPGDWITHRFKHEPFAKVLRVLVAILMLLALTNFLFAQLKALGEMTELVTGGLIPYSVGVLGLAVVILWYESVGGMRAVAWTDAAQGILMLFGLTMMVGWLYTSFGGLEGLTQNIAKLRPEAVAVPQNKSCIGWLSTIFFVGLASAVYPQTIQRVFAAKNSKVLKQSFMMMSFMPLITTGIIILIGLTAIPQLVTLGDINSDQVLPWLLNAWASTGTLQAMCAMTVFLAGLAAIMSTADSVLLSFGSIFTRDLLGHTQNNQNATKFGKRIIVVVTIMTALCALFRDISLWRLIELKLELLIQVVPTIMLGLHWNKMSAKSAVWGIISGCLILAIGMHFGIKNIYGVHIALISLAGNLSTVGVFAIAVSPNHQTSCARA